MAGRAVICSECKKPARDEGAECRYCGTPLPRKAQAKCATCAGTVAAPEAPCTHCGAPIASRRGASAQLLRCATCSSQVSTDAEFCPRCKAPTPGLTAVAPMLSAERRAAEEGPPEAVQAVIEGRATSQLAPLTVDSVMNRTLEKGAGTQAVGAVKEAPKPSGPPMPCRVCGRPNPTDAYMCSSCGIPLRAQPQDNVTAPTTMQSIAWLKPVAMVVVLIAVAVTGQIWRMNADAHDRQTRLRGALGPAASDKDVDTLRQRADVLGVAPEALLMVHRKCFLAPEKTPTEAEMAEAVGGAERGEKRSQLLVAFAQRKCSL